jgi:hypothetical protein
VVEKQGLVMPLEYVFAHPPILHLSRSSELCF